MGDLEYLAMKFWAWTVVLLLSIASPALAQTTQPAPAAWVQTVQSFAKGLDSNDAHGVLTADCVIRSFDTSAPKQAADLTAHTDGATLLLTKAYIFPSETIATDIGAAVADSKVPDDVKKLLI